MKDINRVRQGKIVYEQLLLKLEVLNTMATHITPVLTGMPKGGNKRSDDIWATIADYKTKCIDAIEQYVKDCKELDAEIDALPFRRKSFQTRAVMKCRYLDGMTTEDIAEKLHYSERYVRDLIFDGRRLYDQVHNTKEDE